MIEHLVLVFSKIAIFIKLQLMLLLFSISANGQFKTYGVENNGQIKKFPHLYYEYKIEELSKDTPIKLDYNSDVQKYIDFFLDSRANKLAEYLSLKAYYFPIFESYLDKYNLPLELKYLAIVESGLDPLAQSTSGAKGLWQLLFNSAKLLGLEVNSYVDERCDIFKATDAACRYLKYLYSLYNDWQLAIAAYNGGPGEIRNAIIRSDGKTTFWELQPYLPNQTRYYVPAFIAIVYLINNADQHNIYPIKTWVDTLKTDTLQLYHAVDFLKISEITGVEIDLLRRLNPSYRKDFIPFTQQSMSLVLPSDKILLFLKNEDKIYAYSDTINYYSKITTLSDTNHRKKTIYVVKPGDFLHKIALEFACAPENIMLWNSLQDSNLKIGQKLTIWLRDTIIQNTDDRFFYYMVKKGDTLRTIAERFKCDSINNIKLVNNIKNDKDLKVGQKLKIKVSN